MRLKNSLLPQTASQTAGPYVHIGLAPGEAGFDIYEFELGRDMAAPEVEGDRIRVEGVILDGDGGLVLDALLEVWQADANGVYPEPGAAFAGWGRASTHFETGLWRVETIKPGVVVASDGRAQAPHLTLWIVARGINLGLCTRVYFEGDDLSDDPLLMSIEGEDRRDTLVARRIGEEDGVASYRFDIRLRGAGETVFLDI